jgi:TonB-linked SusC/RagA family outer membrane protein
MSITLVRRGMGRAALALAALLVPPVVHAQTGEIRGTIVHGDTGEPVGAVQLSVEGTGLGVLSSADGTFAITNVPVGVQTLTGQRLGFQALREEGITVSAAEPVSLSITLSPAVLALQGIVATGLVDPVEGVRSPIAVSRISRDMMPVTVSGGAVQNLQGRMAGVRMNRASGQPGSDVNIVLRTPTSLRGDTFPLIVVDGVILGGSGSDGAGVPSTVDLESMDIESIEVIRGAAASSLYGSRAASGVIAITTSRGEGIPQGQTRFSARSEYGVSQNLRPIRLNDSHQYLMNEDRTAYVDFDGNVVGRNERVSPPLTVAFMDNPYPGPVHDNLSAVTHAGSFRNNSFSVSGNGAATNFAVSLSNSLEEGTLRNNRGYERNSFRVNLDHRFMEALSLGVSMYHSRDSRDNLSGNAFNQVLSAPRDVDLSVRDDSGQFLQQPDPDIAYQNPLWTQATREDSQSGTRTLGHLNLAWSPVSWFTTSASVGYDRSDSEARNYVPKGTPTNVGQDGELDGSISFSNQVRDTWNAEAQVTLRRDLGPLNVRTTVRGLLERTETLQGSRSGSNFILAGIPQLSNIRDIDRNATSLQREIRALGYLWDTAFDYEGRYIFTVLGRRDGSSLFGEDNRWHNYYRVAGAWRVGEEEWFDVPNVSELKFSFARGTAGGRPAVTHQYETWGLSGGIPTKGTLGNTELRPEHTLEHEVSMNLVLYDRVGVVLTHARSNTSDLLNPAPLPAITGYSTQWVNAGSVSGHSTEFELEAQLIQRANAAWTSVFVADYSNAHISEWDIPCYAQGWRWNCQDVPVYGLYSRWLIKSHAGLNQHDNGSLVPYVDQFQVNDEGFLVWVGEHNYWEGIEKNLWGTSTVLEGQTLQWGHPIYELTEEGLPHRTLLGEGTAANFGWMNNVRLGRLSFNVHLHSAIGGDANNRLHQILGRNNPATATHLDQAGKPDELKKPIAYYRSAQDGDTSYATQDASYLKLRSLSMSYRVDQDQLNRFGLGGIGVRDMALGLIVRNVFTLTNYEGFDPEGALNLNTRSNSDGGGYPPTRSLTAEVSVTF